MKKPDEDELREYMEDYARLWCERKGLEPPLIDWDRQALEMLDYYEGCAKPNGDWQTKAGVRISNWKRIAQRSVRYAVDRYNARSRAAPVETYRPRSPVQQTPGAARDAINKYFLNYRGDEPSA